MHFLLHYWVCNCNETSLDYYFKMHEEMSYILNADKIQSAVRTIIFAFSFTFVLWYAKYHWNRKHLYKSAKQHPGPLTLPLIGNALYFVGSTNDILYNVLSLIRTYGTPMCAWLGARLFFTICEPKDLEIIMNSPHALKKEDLYKYAEPVVGTGLFTASVSKWKRHRKVIMPTFNQKILNDFVIVFSKQSHILVDQLKKEVGKGTFDIFHYVSRCTLDIISETAMDVSIEAQTNGLDYVKWANKAMEIVYTRMFNIWFHFDFIFNLSPLSKEFDEVVGKMQEFTGKVVKEKREAYQIKCKEQRDLPESFTNEEPKQRKTFLQQLIELSEGGANFTDEELREEVDTFMIAGSDTTASMNSFTFVMLGMHPDVQEKVYQEVMDVLGPDRPVEYADLGQFQYMDRVIRETMRIFPVGPLLVRAVTQDIQFERYTIPAGSSVVMAIIALHWNEKVWPDPFKFDPDRFLPDEVSKRHPYSWLPFSGGPRNCVGETLLECQNCGKRYRHYSSLSRHRSMCVKKTKLRCSLCSYTTSRKDTLTQHKFSRHGLLPNRRIVN